LFCYDVYYVVGGAGRFIPSKLALIKNRTFFHVACTTLLHISRNAADQIAKWFGEEIAKPAAEIANYEIELLKKE
jgi:hypothetical protein